ncbi:MAG: Ger(x)C family spore germination C-terminal domain-containing protein [Ruminococcus sp.]
MRGKNLPKRLSVATEQGTVDCVFSSSAAKFTAVVAEDGTAAVTLQIQLTAEDAMSEETEAQLRKQIQRQCQSAWEETVFQLHADVFSLGALLNSQCHPYAVQTDWATICETATFSCQISIRS